MKYFTIDELAESATARARGIDNTPDPAHCESLKRLTDAVLDPLREAYGKPIYVNSGYRCPALNKAVKGSAKSQHMRGEAADITGGSAAENRKLFELAKSLRLPFDQLIDEYNYRWVHISHKTENNRHQILHLK